MFTGPLQPKAGQEKRRGGGGGRDDEGEGYDAMGQGKRNLVKGKGERNMMGKVRRTQRR